VKKNKRKPKCIIFGAGGHSRVVMESILLSNSAELSGIIDINKKLHGTYLMGIKIFGDDSTIPSLLKQGVTHFVIAIGSIGETGVRRSILQKAEKFMLKPLTVIHPSATISKWCSIEEGSQILANSVINAESTISRFAIINTGAIIEHNCFIGEFAHISPGATLGGNVYVGHDSHIGMGATIRQKITIGEKAIIGAGSVVVKNVPACKTFVGVPAKELKR
jgi:sugar O-acyltransferase (sialic acid O-acetyltransferase NeuD family)